ncbi:MAG: glycosyltransferase family 39 protein [Butyrivibrio sp.]|nr:glycosyltransferase family 39 protein [Butyrivibrio sp.]
MKTTSKDNTALKIVILSLISGLILSVCQGIPFIVNASHGDHVFAMSVIIAISIGLFIHQMANQTLNTEAKCLWVSFFGILTRAYYILMADITFLQNDAGTYTGFATDTINDGHIGYIEYIYKFGSLPNMDPYQYFGYYHPPVHHIIEAIWLTIQRLIGVNESFAFENLQIPTFIYSCLCMAVMYRILKLTTVEKKYFPIAMTIFALHPRMMVLAGSVNNDCLALLLLVCTIWRTLEWLKDDSLKNIILIALSLGFGMITKLNVAICAFSIACLFLIRLVRCIKIGNLVETKKLFIKYVIFGVICVPIGLSYIVRNLILFGEKPGIPSPAIIQSESVMYTGDYSVWSILGIPNDLMIGWPFHGISAAYEHNTWIILFKTSLFAEEYPAGLNDYVLSVAQIAYIAAMIVGIGATLYFFTDLLTNLMRNNKGTLKLVSTEDSNETSMDRKIYGDKNLFLLLTFTFMLISYCMFIFKYPFTCSSDFRYMVACLIFISIAYGKMQTCLKKNFASKKLLFLLNFALGAMLIGSNIVFMFWNVL